MHPVSSSKTVFVPVLHFIPERYRISNVYLYNAIYKSPVAVHGFSVGVKILESLLFENLTTGLVFFSDITISKAGN